MCSQNEAKSISFRKSGRQQGILQYEADRILCVLVRIGDRAGVRVILCLGFFS
jgi:hypothetical protein